MDSVFQVYEIAMKILAARILHLLTVLLSAFLFGWVMADPEYVRLAGAVCFSVLMIILSHVGSKDAERH